MKIMGIVEVIWLTLRGGKVEKQILTGHTAPINRILRSSIVDGPGNRAVIFVQGCNYNCVYCHNPETINLCSGCGGCVIHCPTGAVAIRNGKQYWHSELCIMCDACIRTCSYNSSPRVRDLSASDIIQELKTAIAFVRGITVSGGECTLYPEFLCDLFSCAHEKGLSCFLDSNGSCNFEQFPELLDCTDGIMLDVKAVSNYKSVSGVHDTFILDKAVFLAERRKLWEVRTTIVPNLMDAFEVVHKTCEAIALADNKIRYKLIKYRPMGVRKLQVTSLEIPDDGLMDKLADIVAGYSMTPVIV